jgi:hypothetical protein
MWCHSSSVQGTMKLMSCISFSLSLFKKILIKVILDQSCVFIFFGKNVGKVSSGKLYLRALLMVDIV